MAKNGKLSCKKNRKNHAVLKNRQNHAVFLAIVLPKRHKKSHFLASINQTAEAKNRLFLSLVETRLFSPRPGSAVDRTSPPAYCSRARRSHTSKKHAYFTKIQVKKKKKIVKFQIQFEKNPPQNKSDLSDRLQNIWVIKDLMRLQGRIEVVAAPLMLDAQANIVLDEGVGLPDWRRRQQQRQHARLCQRSRRGRRRRGLLLVLVAGQAVLDDGNPKRHRGRDERRCPGRSWQARWLFYLYLYFICIF
jgi:hypothetical protein